MASSISDMTYAYNNTVVPKEHYSKALSAELEDLMSSDVNIELNLLEPYFKILSDLKKENPKFFFKALVLVERGIKLSSIQSVQVDALNHVYHMYDSAKPKDKRLLSEQLMEEFDDVEKNGLTPGVDEFMDLINRS